MRPLSAFECRVYKRTLQTMAVILGVFSLALLGSGGSLPLAFLSAVLMCTDFVVANQIKETP